MNPSLYKLITLVVLIFSGCASKEDTSALDKAIEQAKAKLATTISESKGFGEGSALRSVLELRRQIQEQTIDLLEQKKSSLLFYSKLNYTVRGAGYNAPADLDNRKKALSARISEVKSEHDQAKGRASVTGGLMASLVALEAQTKALELSQLEYQLGALEFGFPAYIGSAAYEPAAAAPHTKAPAPEPTATIDPNLPTPTPEPTSTPDPRVAALETMKASISIRLLDKKYRPRNWEAGRYENYLTLKLDAENMGDKDIRAVTGLLTFTDLFDREIYSLRLTFDKRIAAHKKVVTSDYGLDINQFKDEHQALVSQEMENLKTTFIPISLIFSDGTRLNSMDD